MDLQAFSSGFFAAHPVLSKSTFRRTPLSADKAAALLDLATVASFTVAPHNNKNKGDPNDLAVAGAECNTVIELKLEHHAA
ncbi:hypothetical protein HKW76_32975 [Pseudomonas aeruginosa]|uniref:hypothetical protein n=1 Tax=Pseudomonas aeruginosa TaxID=287 RepID=UPI00188B1AB3|nr:hypothetical protein [Pseudomonas aeruginosa]MBF2991148.1 hypothetical protein [Pseudomonas aeruginosa]